MSLQEVLMMPEEVDCQHGGGQVKCVHVEGVKENDAQIKEERV